MGPGGLGFLTPSWRKNMARCRIWLEQQRTPIVQPASAARLAEASMQARHGGRADLVSTSLCHGLSKSANLRNNAAALPSAGRINKDPSANTSAFAASTRGHGAAPHHCQQQKFPAGRRACTLAANHRPSPSASSHAAARGAALELKLAMAGSRRWKPARDWMPGVAVLHPYSSVRQTPSRKTSRFGRLGPARP